MGSSLDEGDSGTLRRAAEVGTAGAVMGIAAVPGRLVCGGTPPRYAVRFSRSTADGGVTGKSLDSRVAAVPEGAVSVRVVRTLECPAYVDS